MKTLTAAKIQFAAEEYVEDVWKSDILLRHWKELGHDNDVPLAPDFEMYAALARLNKLRIYTARIEGMLVGYAVFMLGTDVFVKTRIQAVNNLLWLDPMYRLGWTGSHLIQFANGQLKQEGVFSVAHIVSERNPSLGILLERMAFRKQETVWTLRLEERT